MKKILLTIIFGTAIVFAAQAQALRYFQFNNIGCGHGNWQDTSFIAATADPDVINDVLTELGKPLHARKIINGPIAAGAAGINHNADHWFRWHFKESQWTLAEMAIEVCDGCPYSDIDADTAYWLNTVRQYCPWSSQPMREISKPTGVNDVALKAELVVYPNPASSVLNFKWDGANTLNVYMINTVGVVVRTATMYKSLPRLDINELPDGIYFMKINEGNRWVSKTVEVRK